MKEQKVIITSNPDTVNNWLKKGWHVVSVTAQFIATPNSGAYSPVYGMFCFVIET
jgi:hypothetical protein